MTDQDQPWLVREVAREPDANDHFITCGEERIARPHVPHHEKRKGVELPSLDRLVKVDGRLDQTVNDFNVGFREIQAPEEGDKRYESLRFLTDDGRQAYVQEEARRAARRLHRARRDLERIQSERDEAEAALFHGPEIDQSDPIAAGLALRRLDRLAAAKGSEKERLLADPDYQDAALLDLQLARVSGQRADRLRREVAERQDPGRAGALEFEMEAADLLATAIERIESAIADASRLSVRALRQTLPDEDEDDDESVFDDQQEQKEEPKDYLATRLHEVFGTVEQ